MKLNIGELIPLELQLSDGNTAMFPQASVYNAAGSLLSTVNLAHVALGRYENTSLTMTNTPYTVAVYIVYSDSGHTTAGAYDRSSELWQLTATDPSSVVQISAGAITSSSIAADAIGSSQIAASAISEIQTGLATQSSVSQLLSDYTTARAVKLDNLDALVSSRSSGADVSIVQGLLHLNAKIDKATYSPGGLLTSGRVRVFANADALAAANGTNPTDGSEGEVQRYFVSAVDGGTGNASTYKLSKSL